MKLHTDSSRAIETNIDSATSSFSIAVTAKAFEALSSTIYTDKPRAIVRELLCNARDAHLAMGKTAPIELSLPSEKSPFLSIKDHGIGMAGDFVRKLYTTYFESDKNDSDAFTGGFGVGAKSPFSYTDSFTVITTQDHVTRTYSCFKGPSGVPELMQVSEVKSDFASGTEVIVPIKAADFHKFRIAALAVLESFDCPVISDLDPDAYRVEYTMVVDLPVTGVSARLFGGSSGAPRGIMSGVRYPIHFPDKGVLDKLKGGWDLYLPDGAVDVALSREALSNTTRTLAFLSSLGDELVKETVFQAASKVESAKDYFEARSLNRQFWVVPQIKNFPQTADRAHLPVEWRGVPLRGSDVRRAWLKESYPLLSAVAWKHEKYVRRGACHVQKESDPLDLNRGRPAKIYWHDKPVSPAKYYSTRGMLEETWHLILIGPRADAERLLRELGIADMPMESALMLRVSTPKTGAGAAGQVALSTAINNAYPSRYEKKTMSKANIRPEWLDMTYGTPAYKDSHVLTLLHNMDVISGFTTVSSESIAASKALVKAGCQQDLVAWLDTYYPHVDHREVLAKLGALYAFRRSTHFPRDRVHFMENAHMVPGWRGRRAVFNALFRDGDDHLAYDPLVTASPVWKALKESATFKKELARLQGMYINLCKQISDFAAQHREIYAVLASSGSHDYLWAAVIAKLVGKAS